MRSRITAIVLVLALLTGAVGGLAGCKPKQKNGGDIDPAPVGEPKMPDEVLSFDSSGSSVSNGVTYTIYRVIVKVEVNWDNLTDSQRQAIINYAFEAAWYDASVNAVTNYNIIGLRDSAVVSEARTPLFYWEMNGESLIIYIGGVATYFWEAPKKHP
jgi:hypothetical protein